MSAVLDWLRVLATADEYGRVTPSTAIVQSYSRVFRPSGSPTPVLAYADAAGHVYAEWDEGKHPRDGQGQWSASHSKVPAFVGVRADVLAALQRDGISAPVLLTTSMASARGAANDALLAHGGGHAVVLEVRVPVAEVLRVKPGGLWPGRGFSFVRQGGVPAAWISGVAEAQAFAESEAVIFYVPVVLVDDKKAKAYSISHPLYVSRHVENAEEIIAWAKSVGFATTLLAEDMHVTICYSKEPVDWLPLEHWTDMLEVPPEGVRTLAEEDGVWRTVRGRKVFIREGETPVEAIARGKGILVYHGTTSKVLDRIRREGLVPRGGGKKSPSDESGLRGRSVFAVNDKKAASAFAEMNVSRRSGKAVVVELRIPKTMWDREFKSDVRFGTGAHAKYRPGVLPPEYIVDAFIYNKGKFSVLFEQVHEKVTLVTAYAVVWVLDDDSVQKYADRTITNLGEDGAVVLRFESAPLAARHQYFKDHGASWDHDGYHPHITLTYAAPEGMDLSTVEPYTGRIVLGPEQFQELETGWAEDIKEHAEEDGKWITMKGRHVFIRDGETPEEALKRSLDLWIKHEIDVLSQDELHTVQSYLDTNNAGPGKDRLFFAALNKLPQYEGTAWRGIQVANLSDLEKTKLKVGSQFAWKGMAAFSKNQKVAEDFMAFHGDGAVGGIKVLFHGTLKHGADLAPVAKKYGNGAWAYQKEVLTKAKSRFIVKGFSYSPIKRQADIYIEEL